MMDSSLRALRTRISISSIPVGEALCYELSKHGARLVMSARSKQKMEAIRENLPHPENAKCVFESSFVEWCYTTCYYLKCEDLFDLLILCSHYTCTYAVYSMCHKL